MEKIYIRKEKISERVNTLFRDGVVPTDYVEALNEAIKRVTKTIRDNQYMIIEIGSGVKAYNIDSSKVPLKIRVEQGEEIDSTFYL